MPKQNVTFTKFSFYVSYVDENTKLNVVNGSNSTTLNMDDANLSTGEGSPSTYSHYLNNTSISAGAYTNIDTSNLVMNRVSFDDIEDILDKVLDTFLVEIMKDTSINEAFGKDPEFLKKQLREGSCDGKLTYTDYDNKTIWIYYYTTNEEFERISKDISHLFKEKKGK